jgi:hypothetical protein
MNPELIPAPLWIILAIWSLFWKGLALWRAAHSKQQYWFIAMLPINTAGLLEIVYLTKFSKKPLTGKDIRGWVASIQGKNSK